MTTGDLDWRDIALLAAGAITIVTACIHGRLLDPLIVRPLQRSRPEGMRGPSWALVRPIMHVSTIDWFLGGLALVGTGLFLDGPARLAVGLLVCGQLLYATACNAWATRFRHPGWMLMAAAITLTGSAIAGA